MPVRKSTAIWEGKLRNGKGTMRVGNNIFEGKYSFVSRFEEGDGTNPEELLAAAHAGCFSMAFSGELERAGFDPQRIETTANINLVKGEKGFKIESIELQTRGNMTGIEEEKFKELAENAKNNCPVSQLFKGAEIRVSAELIG